MKALVTGGTGFIGSHLAEALLQRGTQVRCLVRKENDLKWLKGLPVEIVSGDCSDQTSLSEAVKEVDEVFHLAGITKAVKEKTYFDVNAFGTENLIRACLENNRRLRKFIYLSSQAAAGPCRNGDKKKESDQCEPISAYGQSKRKGEELALDHAHEIPLIILRPTGVYGPRDKDFYTLFKWVSKRIKPCFSGKVSLCYVQDVIQAILLAAESQTKSGEIFFLSDGTDYPMREVGDVFAKTMGVTPLSVPIPKWLLFGFASFSEYLSLLSRKPSLISRGMAEQMVEKDWTCDITKAKTTLGFQPQFQLSHGAKLTYQWYKNQNWL
ncbi:MAG TPA: SDR family NAD(P)-dependent oxidoreductase [Thermodesulfobacteriota bacterium]|nr:SDR family NAD(P)-dependent oxidoreductase [Thermodesulfobacteriota bacterium]